MVAGGKLTKSKNQGRVVNERIIEVNTLVFTTVAFSFEDNLLIKMKQSYSYFDLRLFHD